MLAPLRKRLMEGFVNVSTCARSIALPFTTAGNLEKESTPFTRCHSATLWVALLATAVFVRNKTMNRHEIVECKFIP